MRMSEDIGISYKLKGKIQNTRPWWSTEHTDKLYITWICIKRIRCSCYG